MNKKLLCAGLAALMLAGCSSNAGTAAKDDAASTGDTTTAAGTTTEKATVTGDDDSETTAEITKTDGKITGVSIDVVTSDGESKKDAGDEYNMKAASTIGKEWYEQVEYLENYIVEHGVDSIKLNSEGYAEDEDVRSNCTINLTEIMKAVDEANAK